MLFRSDSESISFGPTFSFSKEKVGEKVGDCLLHHNIALFQVMLSRSQAALSWAQFTEETRADGKDYSMRSSKVSAILDAQLRIARELRQWLRLLACDGLRVALKLTPIQEEPGEPERPMGLADYMRPILKKAEGAFEEAIEIQRRREAGELDEDAPEDEFGGPAPAPA